MLHLAENKKNKAVRTDIVDRTSSASKLERRKI